MNAKRLTASLLAIAAGICFGVSMLTAWWSLSGSGSGTNVTLSFLPGNSLDASANGSSASGTYSSIGLSTVGGLYETVLIVGIIVMIMSFIGAVIGILWTHGTMTGRSRGGAFEDITVSVAIVALALVVAVPIVQPSAFSQGTFLNCSSLSNTTTPCNSFWGGVSNASATVSWGADVGWYFEVAGAILGVSAAVLWAMSRKEPWPGTTEPAGAKGTAFGTPQPTLAPAWTGYAAQPGPPSPPGPTMVQQSQISPGSWSQTATAGPMLDRFCPSCGFRNAREYAFCSRCGKALPPPPT